MGLVVIGSGAWFYSFFSVFEKELKCRIFLKGVKTYYDFRADSKNYLRLKLKLITCFGFIYALRRGRVTATRFVNQICFH